MPRTVLTAIFIIILLIQVGPALSNLSSKMDNRTVYVDSRNDEGPWDGSLEHPYLNITSSLEHASDGDRVFVRNGTYTERVIINKTVTLEGENRFGTIINGSHYGTVVRVVAHNVHLEEFTIMNSGLFHYYLSGIYLEGSNGSIITNNIVINNYKGILMENSSNNLLVGNEVLDNLENVYLINSNGNNFMNNKLSALGNETFALLLANSNNNTFVHNTFIAGPDAHLISTTESLNRWDDGTEGNYWSNYGGIDDNHDAIGDSPYTISLSDRDNYPLMGTYDDFATDYENQEYHVSMISNSTVGEFEFNSTLEMLRFNIATPNGAPGFCRVTIPHLLMTIPYIVLINDEQVNATSLSISNVTHTFLYFTFHNDPVVVSIFPKPYYELLLRYDGLLSDLANLNQSLTTLNQTYNNLYSEYQSKVNEITQLLSDLANLNQSLTTLGQTYQQLNTSYSMLQENYASLARMYDSLNFTYNKSEKENSDTRLILSTVSASTAIVVVFFAALAMKYRKSFRQQKELTEKYRKETEHSRLSVARSQFDTDVRRREGKIDDFTRKYGITIRPKNTLEEVIESLDLKKKKED
jgi:parallel beta-helix repeat protein